MKLIRCGEPNQERPGVLLDDGERIDTSAIVSDYDEAFFAADGLATLRAWLDRHAASAPRIGGDIRLGPPIRRPNKIVCVGLNYRDHAAESGMDVPREPVLFLKATTSLAGPNDSVVIPRGASKLDWEVELAIVIGKTAQYVDQANALEHVAGFALHNDYSERAFQLERGGQWVKGKSADTFAPLGPFVVTRDELPDPGRLEMWLTVNGETRQKSSTAQMIFDTAALVSYISGFMTLLPGDVISTGTPAGVGLGMRPHPVYLKEGDEVALGIDRLGEQRQRIAAYRAKQ
jgi:2-keto-4-pentenoate hydratase/2-oxohepta-3-ene-1,7-dioic acid hydratase in catechol pathway